MEQTEYKAADEFSEEPEESNGMGKKQDRFSV